MVSAVSQFPALTPRPPKSPKSRVESYRELALQAINRVAEFRSRAEQYAAKGDQQIADAYQQQTNEAIARAELVSRPSPTLLQESLRHP